MKKCLLLILIIFGCNIITKAQSNHTVTFTGSSSDFNANELYSSVDNVNYYMTFDATYAYFGAFRTNSNNFSSYDHFTIYIDKDPTSSRTSGGNGSTTGVNWDGNTPNLPFLADYRIAIRNNSSGESFYSNYSGSSWTTGAANAQHYTQWSTSGGLEIRVPWSDLGNPSGIYFIMYCSYSGGFYGASPNGSSGSAPSTTNYFGGIGVSSQGCSPTSNINIPITGQLSNSNPTSGATYGLVSISSGSYTAAGNFTIASGGSINVSGGSLTLGSNTVTMGAGSTIANNGATISTSGSTINCSGDITFSGSSSISLNTINFTSGNTANIATPVITSTNYSMVSGATNTFNFTNNATFTTAGISSTGTNTLNLVNGGSSGSSKFISSAALSIVTGTSLSLGSSNLPLQVNSYVSLSGTGSLTLGTNPGGDIYLTGNWSYGSGGTLTANSRAVNFTGTGTQTISSTSAPNTFDYLAVNKTAGSVQLSNAVTLNNNLQLFNGTLDLNQHSISFTNGGNLELGNGSSTATTESIISSGGSGTVSIPSSKTVTVSNSGTGTPSFSFGSNVLVDVAGIFNPGALSTFASGSTLRLSGAGYLLTNSPTFSTGSSLVYNGAQTLSSPYVTSLEWPSGSPSNITIQNSTNVALSGSRSINGNFAINSGSLRSSSGAQTLTLSGGTSGSPTTFTESGSMYGEYGGATLNLIFSGYTSLAGSTGYLDAKNYTVTGTGTLNCGSIGLNSNSSSPAAGLVTISSGGTLMTSNINGLYDGSSLNPTIRWASGLMQVPSISSSSTIIYNAAGGGQTITSSPNYGNLTVSNTSSTNTAAGNLSVSGALTTTAGGTLDMSSYTLTAGSITNGGTLKTSNTSATPITSGLTYAGTVQYALSTGGQTIVANTYNNLTSSNTSGTNSLGGNISVNGVLSNSSGGTLTIGSNTLTLNGSTSLSGSLIGSSSSNVTVGSTSGSTTLVFDQTSTNSYLNTLTVSGSGGATLGSNVNLTNLLNLSAGTLTLGNYNITLKSTAIGSTAQVGTITGAVNYTGTGRFVNERIITNGGTSKRTYRNLSPGLYTDNSYIWDNWQEGATTATPNPNSGYGTQITGEKNGSAGVDATTGIDYTQTGNPSLWYYVNGGFSAVTNTKTAVLAPYKGYYITIRGDRSINLYDNNAPLTFSNTTLRAKGKLIIGDVTINTSGTSYSFDGSTPQTDNSNKLNNTAGGFSMVGNPYASAIDFSTISTTNLVSGYYWYFDPSLSTAGAYTVYDVSTGLNTGGSSTQYIQPGEAFFVRTSGVSPSLTIHEISKSVSSPQVSVFGGDPNNPASNIVRMTLSKQVNSTPVNLDASILVTGSNYSNTVLLNEDAVKMNNSTENISLNETGNYLAIDKRQVLQSGDSLAVRVWNTTAGTTYSLLLDGTQSSETLYLYDKYTGNSTALPQNNMVTVNFTPTTDTLSYINRFVLVSKIKTPPIVWGGNISSNWSDAGNWSSGTVPTSLDNIEVSGTAVHTLIIDATVSTNNITVDPGANLIVTGNLQISGSISNNGIFDATGGSIILNGETGQYIPAALFKNNSVQNLMINNGSGVTLGGPLSVTGILTAKAGTFNTGNNLTLVSTASGTASVAPIDGTTNNGSFSGNVIMQQWNIAQRGYRVLSNPFVSKQPLSELTANFTITGNGPGLTAGNPSAFTYTATAPNTQAFSAITSANTSIWNYTAPVFVMIRGMGNQGIGFDYTNCSNCNGGVPTAFALNATGALNDGTAVSDFALQYSATGNNFNLIGNPYASAVNLKNLLSNGSAISSNTNIGSTFYVYNPVKNAGVSTIMRGGYDAYSNDGQTDVIIPSMGAFFIQSLTAGQTIGFTESAKSTATPLALMGSGNAVPQLKLSVISNLGSWDNVQLRFDAGASNKSNDRYDAPKWSNQLFDLYSIAADNSKLTIDSRALNNTTIPLGINTGVTDNSFRFKVDQISGMDNTAILLRDKLLKNETSLKVAGDSLAFSITADSLTQGNNRFELVFSNKAVGSVSVIDSSSSAVNVYPNPVKDHIIINTGTGKGSTIQIINASGKVISETISSNQITDIPFGEAAEGVYFVRIIASDGTVLVKKIVK